MLVHASNLGCALRRVSVCVKHCFHCCIECAKQMGGTSSSNADSESVAETERKFRREIVKAVESQAELVLDVDTGDDNSWKITYIDAAAVHIFGSVICACISEGVFEALTPQASIYLLRCSGERLQPKKRVTIRPFVRALQYESQASNAMLQLSAESSGLFSFIDEVKTDRRALFHDVFDLGVVTLMANELVKANAVDVTNETGQTFIEFLVQSLANASSEDRAALLHKCIQQVLNAMIASPADVSLPELRIPDELSNSNDAAKISYRNTQASISHAISALDRRKATFLEQLEAYVPMRGQAALLIMRLWMRSDHPFSIADIAASCSASAAASSGEQAAAAAAAAAGRSWIDDGAVAGTAVSSSLSTMRLPPRRSAAPASIASAAP